MEEILHLPLRGLFSGEGYILGGGDLISAVYGILSLKFKVSRTQFLSCKLLD